MADDDRPKSLQPPSLDYARKVMRGVSYGDAESALKTASMAYDPKWRKWAGPKNAAASEDYSKKIGISKAHYDSLSKKSDDDAFDQEADRFNARAEKASGLNKIPQYKRGGLVKKTGLAKVHKGERVLTKKQTSKLSRKGR